MTADSTRPVNAPTSGRIGPWSNQDTQFFWDGARARKLLIQQCVSCDKLRHPPGPMCPFCHSLDWKTLEASGRGALYSYTVLHHPSAPGFDGPAVGVIVELEEGVRVVSNLVDGDVADLRIGELLGVVFVDQSEGYTLPLFRRLARDASAD